MAVSPVLATPGKIGDTEPGAMRLPPHSAGSEHPAWRSLAA
jgi:hypothetical protein